MRGDFKNLCKKKKKKHKTKLVCANARITLAHCACGALPRGSSLTSFTWKEAEAFIMQNDRTVQCQMVQVFFSFSAPEIQNSIYQNALECQRPWLLQLSKYK